MTKQQNWEKKHKTTNYQEREGKRGKKKNKKQKQIKHWKWMIKKIYI